MFANAMPLSVDFANVAAHVSDEAIAALQPRVDAAHAALEAREGPSKDWAGWLHRASAFPADELARIESVGREIRDNADVFVSIGIGGSYLGGRAAVDFAATTCEPEVLFFGQHLSADALAGVDDLLRDRSVYINMISRSGGTVEPGVAFRFFRKALTDRYGADAKDRIFVTSTAGSPLWKLAEENGYRRFAIPDDIGGRYSAFTPVVLLPAAVAGVSVARILAGAVSAEAATGSASLDENPAYRMAAVRKRLHDGGKTIEVMAAFDPSLHTLGQWWRQLAGESEGKDGRGIFPACVDYTSDLHSMGQWMQEGARSVFETFLTLGAPNHEAVVPEMANANDGFDYLQGKAVSDINRSAWQATAQAHLQGDVPNMTMELADRSPEALGAFFYFHMRAVAMTGFLFGVNPFDQPGVEAYKDIMVRLLGRAGH